MIKNKFKFQAAIAAVLRERNRRPPSAKGTASPPSTVATP